MLLYILHLGLYHLRICASTRDRDPPDPCKARLEHQFPVRLTKDGPKTISEERPMLFEIVEQSLDQHSDIQNPTARNV